MPRIPVLFAELRLPLRPVHFCLPTPKHGRARADLQGIASRGAARRCLKRDSSEEVAANPLVHCKGPLRGQPLSSFWRKAQTSLSRRVSQTLPDVAFPLAGDWPLASTTYLNLTLPNLLMLWQSQLVPLGMGHPSRPAGPPFHFSLAFLAKSGASLGKVFPTVGITLFCGLTYRRIGR